MKFSEILKQHSIVNQEFGTVFTTEPDGSKTATKYMAFRDSNNPSRTVSMHVDLFDKLNKATKPITDLTADLYVREVNGTQLTTISVRELIKGEIRGTIKNQ